MSVPRTVCSMCFKIVAAMRPYSCLKLTRQQRLLFILPVPPFQFLRVAFFADGVRIINSATERVQQTAVLDDTRQRIGLVVEGFRTFTLQVLPTLNAQAQQIRSDRLTHAWYLHQFFWRFHLQPLLS